jgi:hypothetical protein
MKLSKGKAGNYGLGQIYNNEDHMERIQVSSAFGDE